MNERIRIPLTGFQHRSFPFWGELKQPSWVLPTSCFPMAVKLWSSIKYSRKLTLLSHSSRAACHLGISNLDRVLEKDEISKLYFVFQDSLSPSGKLLVKECDNKASYLENIMKRKGFQYNAVEKQMFRSTKLGCFTSPQRGKLRC